MPRKDDKLAVVSSGTNAAQEEAPPQRQSYISQFTALPVQVIVSEVAIRRLRGIYTMVDGKRVYSKFDEEYLRTLSPDKLQRFYHYRMNEFKPHSGDRVFVVATEDEVASKYDEVQRKFAMLRGYVTDLPTQRIDLDATSELVGAAS